MGLPLGRNLIETLGSQVCLHAVLEAGGLEGGLQVLSGGNHCLLEVAEGVEDVEAQSKS